MKHQKGYTTLNIGILIYAALMIGGVIGWVLNIVDIVHADFDNVTGMLVLRIIGVFVPPLGAVLGYF
jgi:hypothetical protein